MPARYEMSSRVKGAFAEVKARVVDALKAQGFGVLTEIDVQKTLKEKLGADMEPYLILGTCNPQLAHQALNAGTCCAREKTISGSAPLARAAEPPTLPT